MADKMLRSGPMPVRLSSASRQPSRRHQMGIRVRLADREPVGLALRRLRKLLYDSGIHREIWVHSFYVKDSQIKRHRKHVKLLKARRAISLAKCAGER